MFVWGLAQLAGSLALLWQPVLPHAGIFFLSVPLALAALSAPRTRWFAALWLGAALAAWQAQDRLDDRLAPALDGAVVTVTGRIASLVEDDERRQRFLFAIEAGEQDGTPLDLPRLVRLNLYDPLEIRPGERWQWRVKLRRPRGFANPGGFDYERWLFFQGIGATGYVHRPEEARQLEVAAGEWRPAIAARMAALAKGPAAGLLRGLATGDQSGITDAQWELLRRTGTTHLVSVSGLHIALVAGLGLGIATRVRRRWLPSAGLHWPPLAGSGLALGYGALAGFGLPVTRALLAATLLLSALALRRRLAVAHAFGTALTIVLCLEPLASLDIGFWLSFGAVAAIVFLCTGRRPAGSRLHQALHVQAGLFLLLAPLILLIFGRLPLLSAPANLIAVPVFDALAVPCVLLALCLLPWPTLAGAVLTVPAWLLERLLELLAWFAALELDFTSVALSPAVQLLAVAGLVLACAPRAWPGRLFAAWLLLPAVWVNLPAARGDALPLTAHFLDVGQGLAVVVETATHTLVYDTGPSFGAGDAAAMVLIPFLENRGRRPDLLLVSHGDNDHAGGLASLAARWPETPRLGRVRDMADVADCAGRSWRWDKVSFRVLHPSAGVGSGNDDSCVLRVESRGKVLLLTGDIEAAAEARLLAASADDLAADVALLPHHGSRTSSTPAFVRAVAANLAIAAAGHGNRWDFPKADVVRRWQDTGARVLSTGGQGAISVEFTQEEIRVRSFRDEARLWREPPASSDGGSLMSRK